jgi:hypothetical protein
MCGRKLAGTELRPMGHEPFGPGLPYWKHSLAYCYSLSYMVNHGSLICSNMRPIYVDLSELRHLRQLGHFGHLRYLRHVIYIIYVIYVSASNFISPLRGCGAAHSFVQFFAKITSLDFSTCMLLFLIHVVMILSKSDLNSRIFT